MSSIPFKTRIKLWRDMLIPSSIRKKFSNLKRKKQLEAKIQSVWSSWENELNSTASEHEHSGLLSHIYQELEPYERELERIKYSKLFSRAKKYGLNIAEYWSPTDGMKHEAEYKLQLLVRQKRREDIEWWVTKIIIPVITAITGLASIIVAILALVK